MAVAGGAEGRRAVGAGAARAEQAAVEWAGVE